MPDPDPVPDPADHRRRALSTWDTDGVETAQVPDGAHVPDLTNTELVQLRIRVIALENMLIAVLAEGSDRQLQVAREMADYISPRPGSTQHPLTTQAAGHMTDIADRAVHFRTVPPQ